MIIFFEYFDMVFGMMKNSLLNFFA